MEVVGLVLTGAEVRRPTQDVPASVEVNVNVDRITPKTPERVLLDFTYSVDYKPNAGMLRITGIADCRDSADNIREMLAEYKKKKIVPMEYGASVINMINANAGLNGIFVIRPFNLLPPFMPPMLAEAPPKAAAKK